MLCTFVKIYFLPTLQCFSFPLIFSVKGQLPKLFGVRTCVMLTFFLSFFLSFFGFSAAVFAFFVIHSFICLYVYCFRFAVTTHFSSVRDSRKSHEVVMGISTQKSCSLGDNEIVKINYKLCGKKCCLLFVKCLETTSLTISNNSCAFPSLALNHLHFKTTDYIN